MHSFYAITSGPLPERLFAHQGGIAIRTLSQPERIQFEDAFFRKKHDVKIPESATAVIVPREPSLKHGMAAHATLVEFALGILTTSGFQQIDVVGIRAPSGLRDVHQLPGATSIEPPIFGEGLRGLVIGAWVARFFKAVDNTPDRMHITADRFVRYLREPNSTDSLLDLCISLESLLDSQTEISFRFSTSLTKVIGRSGQAAQKAAELLQDLYDLRSKIVHGDPKSAKIFDALKPRQASLRGLGREILIRYVLYMSEHTRQEWKEHLRTTLFA